MDVNLMKKMRPNPRVFGHIPGVLVGTTFASREICSLSAVHPGILAGIYGTRDDGAYSVALSGGYEDDKDEGETFTYTGCGGRDLKGPNGKSLRTGPQSEDQTFDYRSNRALQRSAETGKPVRVVRGFKLDSIFAPPAGYRYDGLYTVTRAWREEGQAGFLVCRYTFVRLPDQPPLPRLSYALNLNNMKKSKRAANRRQRQAVREASVIPMKDERRLSKSVVRKPLPWGLANAPSTSATPPPSSSRAGPSDANAAPPSGRLMFPLPRAPPVPPPRAKPPVPPVTNIRLVYKNGIPEFVED